MMSDTEKTLSLFETRVRQMILRFAEVKKENEELYRMMEEQEGNVKQLEAQLTQAQNDYNTLKMAKMLEITDGDMESAQKRVAKLIREVNKCITLLSEQ